MTLGVTLKACNAIYHRDKLEFFHEFVPQILFFLCLMGYMDTLIILKWTTDYTHVEYEAPSIISTMIAAMLNGGTIEGRAFIGSHAENARLSNCLICKFKPLIF